MKKTAIYARGSIETSAQLNIAKQLEKCRRYANDNGLCVVEEYVDRSSSGPCKERPAFRAMLKDAELREWDIIIVYSLSRISRKHDEIEAVKKDLRGNGVTLFSVSENGDEAP